MPAASQRFLAPGFRFFLRKPIKNYCEVPMSFPSFLSHRLALVQEQQLELAVLAEHVKRGSGHVRRLALECLAHRQAELAADLAQVAQLAAPRAALRKEVAA